jgi:hypothetical protein
MKVNPSIERIREVFEYNPEMGTLRWKITNSPRAVAGSIAGTRMKNGYLGVGLDKADHYVHRLAWALTYNRWPFQIDHINNNKADNRLCNLREADFSKNAVNRPIRRDNKSGETGVHFDKSRNQWKVDVGHKTHGRFNSKKEAIKKRRKMAKLAYGEFCYHS